jgi:DNA (cytosine-5)-methyltransferase 1
LRVLDLFCGAGGASAGYRRSFPACEIIGVDNSPQPRYPYTFLKEDAYAALRDVEWCRTFDLIHASPPCQRYSVAGRIHGSGHHPNLIPTVRYRLQKVGVPWVIENVPGAPLHNPVLVCGRALNLGVRRHRLFESNLPLVGTGCPKGHPGDWVSVFGHTVLNRGHNRVEQTVARGRAAMQIDWMTLDELSEAIPPAYTEFIGFQLTHLDRW